MTTKEQAKAWRARNAEKIKAYRTKNFEKANQRAKDWRTANPEQAKSRIQAWNKKFPWKAREANLRQFGLSIEDYEGMLAKQNGTCQICCEPPGVRRLAVDHCHVSGKVRGLLCINCNHALGKMKDSPELLEAAAQYLRRNS